MSISKLMCIAHAGGSASSYLRWKKQLTSTTKLIPLEYSGRGLRSGESLYETMDEVVSDLLDEMEPYLADQTPYALYGHSMGALVAFELALIIQQSGLQGPSLLIVSGKNPPHIYGRTDRHTLPETQFREELVNMGGTPSELIQDKSFDDYFLPIARADFKVVETYQIQDNKPKLHTDIIILNGEDDTFVSLERMKEWGRI